MLKHYCEKVLHHLLVDLFDSFRHRASIFIADQKYLYRASFNRGRKHFTISKNKLFRSKSSTR